MTHTLNNTNFFGTDGIRGAVGAEPFTLESLEKLGKAIACWIQEKYGPHATVLLAQDTRISCSFVSAALQAGLLRYPLKIFDAHVLPTAGVVQILQYEKHYNCGIIISASHNPYYDNGIKIVDGLAGKITALDENRINYFFSLNNEPLYTILGTSQPFIDASSFYQKKIKSFFPHNFLQGKKIVLDCAQGAAYQIAPQLFKDFGATVIAINDQPNGININENCGALHPEMVREKVIALNADAGFSFDGDADRVIAINRNGQIKDGDDLLALLLLHPYYQKSNAVVGTIMTNQAFEHHLKNTNKQLLRAPVGDKHVAQLMATHNISLGGEPSGHIIASQYLNTGDGIFIALLVCETMNVHSNWDMVTFSKFPQIILNLSVRNRRDLQEPLLNQIITQSRMALHKGRLIVRYSGTESLLRIMVEDDSYEHAVSVGTALSGELQKLLS